MSPFPTLPGQEWFLEVLGGLKKSLGKAKMQDCAGCRLIKSHLHGLVPPRDTAWDLLPSGPLGLMGDILSSSILARDWATNL